ncbi:MAG: hypothetical protein ACRD2X_14005 [Vicinamibacteraceae bacterium]
MNESKTSPISSEALSPEELEEILRRIDENLELRPLLLSSEEPDQPLGEEAVLVPLPELGDLPTRIQTVRAFNAPYFLVREGGIRRWLRHLLNLPLRLFGHKQAVFNMHALDALEQLTAQVLALRHRSEQQAAEARRQLRWSQGVNERLLRLIPEDGDPFESLARTAMTTRERVTRADDALRSLQAELQESRTVLAAANERIASLQQDVSALRDGTERTQKDGQGLHQWIENVAQTQRKLADHIHGHTAWIELVQREVQAAALAARGRASAGEPTALEEPRIQNPEQYAELTSRMPDGLLVNLGCGVRPKDQWINVDSRPLPYVEVVADVRRLPFEPGSVAAFEAAHLVEHFRQHEMQTEILPYWLTLLKPGGTLRIVCPNLAAVIEESAAGRLTLDQAEALIFGGQEYEGNDHFAMYWPESLQSMLAAAGFSRSEVVARNRMNGACPEVEIVAYR